MTQRDFLFQRWLDKKATTEELDELSRIIANEGYSEDDELFQQLVKELEQKKTISEVDRSHAINTFQSRWNKRENLSEKEVIPIHRSRSYAWWSAAAAIVVAIGLAWYTDGFKGNKFREFATVSEVPDTTITITTGNNTKFVLLPDSSTVLLNENSSLTYTRRYGFDTREVTLTGEGFFDVAHNPLTPFRVKTGRIVTNVLGTAFNIKVVKDASGGENFTVTVSRGKVGVSDDKQSYGTLIPNEQISVNTDNHVAVRSNVKAELATAWTNQFLIINNLAFKDALDMVEAKFNVKINLENQDVKTCRITSAFLEKPKLETVIKVISSAVNAKYAINKNGSVTISGGECKR